MECHRLRGGGTVYVARSFPERLLGLAGLAALPYGVGVLFPACDSVHTAWMRVPIDVVFLDDRCRVLEVRRGLRPWRIARRRGAACVIECRAGGAGILGLSAPCCRAATPA